MNIITQKASNVIQIAFNKIKELDERDLQYLVLSIIFALILVSIDDLMLVVDRNNYLVYAESSFEIVQRYIKKGGFSLFFNEPIFLIVNILLSIFLSPVNVLRVIIFFAVFLLLYSMGKLSNYNLWYLVLFLLSPTILLKYVVHIRQGLAMSVYFFGIVGLKQGKKYKWLRVVSAFIHSSMFFLLMFEVVESILRKYEENSNKRLFISSIAFIVIMVLIPFFARMFGDRRASQYLFQFGLSGSGLGLVFWFIFGSIFIKKHTINYISTISSYGIIFYIISYFYLDFGARIFESVYPLIILSSITDQNKNNRIGFTLILVVYGLLNLILRGGYNF